MSSNYTGDDTATQAPSPLPAKNATPVLTLPADGDPLNAASIAQAFRALADAIDFLFDRAAILDSANTFASGQTFNGPVLLNGTSGDDANYTRFFTGTITTRHLQDYLLGSTSHVRTYSTNDGEYEIVSNAVWNTAGINANKWTQDSGATASFRCKVSFAGQRFQWEFKAAGSAAWVDGSWVVAQYIDLNGDVTVTRDMLAGRNVNAASGNVTAAGTVAGSSGPGLLKGKRLYGTGTALATGDFSLSAGWGNTAAKNAANGTDMAGFLTFTAGGGAKNADPTVTLTFKDGTFTTAPTVIASLRSAPGFADYLPLQVTTISATQVTITYLTNGANPSDGVYIISFQTVGI